MHLPVVIILIGMYGCSLSKEPAKPNIVYILADDLGYADLSCYGQKNFSTPNIDKMAREGIRFTNHYSGSTVCAPSRSVLMTGQHSGHTPIRDNKEVGEEGQYPLKDEAFTIAEMLKAAGYATGAFGKWGLGFVGTEGDPNRQGFDEFYGYNCQRFAHRYYPKYLWDNNHKVELPGNDWTKNISYAPDFIHGKAIKFIEKNKDRPFFLFYPTTIPHAELIVPDDESFKNYKDNFEERPYSGGNAPSREAASYGPGISISGYCPQEYPKATFASMISRLDRYVGDIIQRLKELGLDENTLIVFTSDNGPHGEGGIHPDDFDSNGRLRGMKRDLFEGGIRVPMIARWPEKIRGGRETDLISAFWDIMPTLADIAGAYPPNNIDGISMLPTLMDIKGQDTHDHLYWEYHSQGGKQAVRKGKWKALRLNYRDKSKTTVLLFNLDDDPSEERDIADCYPELTKEMIEILENESTYSDIFPFHQE